MRLFKLHRDEDISGVSGTGVVAYGIEFPDGQCVLWWDTVYKSLAIYKNIEDVQGIHGHDGRTRVVFDE